MSESMPSNPAVQVLKQGTTHEVDKRPPSALDPAVAMAQWNQRVCEGMDRMAADESYRQAMGKRLS